MQTHDLQQGQPLDDEALDQAAGGASISLSFTSGSPQPPSLLVFQANKGLASGAASVAWFSSPAWTPSPQFDWTVNYSPFLKKD